MIDRIPVVEMIKRKFDKPNRVVKIPSQGGRQFKATMTDDGIIVDNLGSRSLLPWIVFEEVVNLLDRNGGRAENGNAISAKLGEAGLSLESVEGHVAQWVYGKKIGDSVFRRIFPITAILVWAGLCNTMPHQLILRRSTP
jgi:hypothetical protein